MSSAPLEQRIPQPYTDRLGLAVVRQRRLTQFSSNSTLLVATKRQLMVQHVILVNPDRTRPQRTTDADGSVQVAGVHGGGQTVGSGVAKLDGFLLGGKFADGADRAEDLLLHDLHLRGDVAEDGGLDEVALVAVAPAADLDFGAFFLAGVDIAVGFHFMSVTRVSRGKK